LKQFLNQLKSDNLQIKNKEFEVNGIRQAIEIAHQKRIENKRAK
jgi:hypothetical protein